MKHDPDLEMFERAKAAAIAQHEKIVEHDYQRTMAFKRIVAEFDKPRRRTKEMLKWWRENPSPRSPAEQMRNLMRALFE